MMNDPFLRWPYMPSDIGEPMSRRTDELYDIDNTPLDDDGLIEAAVIPLKDTVLFPNLVTPLFVVDESIKAVIEDEIGGGGTMIAVAQHTPDIEDPTPDDLFVTGTEVAVSRPLRIPDGSFSVLTQGRRRIEIVEFFYENEQLRARGRPMDEIQDQSKETMALMRAVLTLFERAVRLNRSLPEETYIYAVNVEEPGWLADLIATSLNFSVGEKQEILEIFHPADRLQHLSMLLGRELELLQMEEDIHSRVQNEVDRSQREMYLREQMRQIQTELGEGDIWSQEISDLTDRIAEMTLPDDIRERALQEIQRLSQMPPMSPEVGIVRSYLDWLIELPWTEHTDDNLGIRHVSRVLNRNHYGIKEAKDRILEYIAVRSLAPDAQRQPVLCFVGPPGTGKTSLGRSIASALGRNFWRISLGGIRDEAEIRGHRRTYIGALPGRILQGMRRAGMINPLYMLDEIDKLGQDFRGDPSSALLEVLDPEQNFEFSDHYLELPYDLSNVMFVTTANTLDPIPPALRDRLEVIEFPGYVEEEKIIIANKFLIPRQLEQNGIEKSDSLLPEDTLKKIIREYTWEAGVRNLEREIGKLARKIARMKAEGKDQPDEIGDGKLHKWLGPPKISPRSLESEDQVGAATVLAWTESGGDTLSVEVLILDGKGSVQITGQLGDVMQESAQAALSYIRSRADELAIKPQRFEQSEVHVHFPEGAIPKDGPSAGITMATAIASAFSGIPVRRDVGMTGEITLRGRVLPVGGVREKILAGYRLGLKEIILPAENRKDVVDIPVNAKRALKIHYVDHMDQVMKIALARPQKQKRKASSARKKGQSSTAQPTAG